MSQQHDLRMQELLARRSIRKARRDISQMQIDDVRAELREKSCNPLGDEPIIRERLLRALLKESEKYAHLVPWYAFDELHPVNLSDDEESLVNRGTGNVPADEFNVPRSSASVLTPQNVRESREATPREQDDANNQQLAAREPAVDAPQDLENPNAFIPVAASMPMLSTATTTVSTAPMSTMSATIGGRPYSQVENRNAHFTLAGLANEQLTQQRVQWGYYSARRVRVGELISLGVAGEELAPPRAAEPSRPTPAPRRSLVNPENETADEYVMNMSMSTRGSSPGSTEYKTPMAGIRSRAPATAWQPTANRWAQPVRRVVLESDQDDLYEQNIHVQHGETPAPRRTRENGTQTPPFMREPLGSRIPVRSPPRRRQRTEVLDVSSGAEEVQTIFRQEAPRRTEAPRTRNVRVSEPGRHPSPRRRHTDVTTGESSGPEHDWQVVTPRRKRRRGRRPDNHRRSDPNASYDSFASGISGRSSPVTSPMAVKLLTTWGVKFSGDEKEDAEEFIEKLKECVQSTNIPVVDILRALPCVLTKHAVRWFRTVRREIITWRDFEKHFRNRFVPIYDRVDLMDELHKRTQGKGEKITTYLANFRFIVSRFTRPPRERELVDIVWRNLLPEYRRALADKLVDSLRDIEEYGRKWERQKDLDHRYVPPPLPEKMRVKGAAYEPSSRAKLASVEENESVAATATTPSPSRGSKGGSKRSGKSESTEQSAPTAPKQEVSFADVAASPSRFTKAQLVAALQGLKVQTTLAPSNPPRGQQSAQGADLPKSEKRNERPAPAAAGAAAARAPFTGTCHKCNQPGHMVSRCPEITCRYCNQKGHVMRICPGRAAAPQVSCQVCGFEGAVFQNCTTCAGLREHFERLRSGNGKVGEQKRE